ncbi:hypothetical protein ACT17Q_11800 [Cellulomonas sp. CW35]|uniref:Uncharacterized protein n=1 Tax=Cellulomonas uda TaxID=1714 RepID=A0A4Y3K9L4_CELUD|nr:hypothetical protein [Cellulomonas uda]NII66765.1 hypothetical protein [Cellulomonas uda]GEA80406.1 hypothetical protein CUD01_08500 [Cellulomonas uda]
MDQADARGATTDGGRPAAGGTGSPAGGARPTRATLVRPLVLLVASAAALVGIVMLLTTLITLGSQSLDASESGDVPCLEAVSGSVQGASLDNAYLPPRATCTWLVDGAPQTVVVAQPSVPVFWVGLALAVVGVVTCASVLLAGRRRASRARATR